GGWGINLLARWRRPELLAILVTGLCFGLLHAAQLGWAWAAVLILVLVGIVLTAVRAVTGSLMASWLFHAAYNGTLFGVQYVVTQGFRHFPPGLH
ncbi:MAG: CPBP family glutamic-type intramembrane protease, partial [Terriglobales bacterium]